MGALMHIPLKAKWSLLLLGCIVGCFWFVRTNYSASGAEAMTTLSNESARKTENEIRTKIEDAIGLAVATVSVRMQRENAITEFIPWMDVATPIVRISLPQTWITKQSRQVGGEELALGAIMNLVFEVTPDADVEIVKVQNISAASAHVQSKESYAKQIVLLLGLSAMLLSGLVADCRRRKEEIVVMQKARTPEEEANRILQMEHSLARSAMDSLVGTRKFEVLHAIVSSNDAIEEIPMVEVAKGTQLERIECG
jgi:hypothetical protein